MTRHRWLLVLSVWRLTAQALVCTFVQLAEFTTPQEDAMAATASATWAMNATFGGRGGLSFWSYLVKKNGLSDCRWFLLVPSVHLYVNFLALEVFLRMLSDSSSSLLTLGNDSTAPRLISAELAWSCLHRDSRSQSDSESCLLETKACGLAEIVGLTTARSMLDLRGFHDFVPRPADSCLLMVLNVRGRVHIEHIHQTVHAGGGMRSCMLHQPFADLSNEARQRCALPALPALPDLMGRRPRLDGPLCIFIPLLPPPDAQAEEVDAIVEMAVTVRDTWGTNSTVFIVPSQEESPLGFVERLPANMVSQLAAQEGETHWSKVGPSQRLVGSVFRSWRHAVELAQAAGTCEWAMKVSLWTYVNAHFLESKLLCLNSSKLWYLGMTTAAYSPGLSPFMFADDKAGSILSQGAYEEVRVWSGACLGQWTSEDGPGVPAGPDFIGDYAFALCLDDLGGVKAMNFADIEASFVVSVRATRTLEMFEAHPDSLKQCLISVGSLAGPTDLRRVHERIVWSGWHESIPCIGESQMGKFRIADALGNEQPYYHEEIRLANYYCKDPEMITLEQELSNLTAGRNPRDGPGSPTILPSPAPPSEVRRHLCIFVPSSARKRKFVEAAEAAWRAWGTADTFFVSATPLNSSEIDSRTWVLDLDVDTDYARLPVRTLRLFEALGRPEWADACDWYMKADADSFLNVPLVAERIRCFNPNELWFLGVPQVAHGKTGSTTWFASGGAGYIISRALVPKLATWAPFCLLQLLQYTGGTGMEDVSLAECLWKWGRLRATSYVDQEREVITSEAQLNRTQVAKVLPSESESVPACTFVVHSLTPHELPVAKENIQRAAERMAASLGKKPHCRPSAERLRHLSEVVLQPGDSRTSPRDKPAFETYQPRELDALLRCSDEGG